MASLSLGTAASRLLPSAAAATTKLSTSSSAHSVKFLRSSPLVSHLFLHQVLSSPCIRVPLFTRGAEFWLFIIIIIICLWSFDLQKRAVWKRSSSYSTVTVTPKCFASDPEQLTRAREDIKEILRTKFCHPILVTSCFSISIAFLLFLFSFLID